LDFQGLHNLAKHNIYLRENCESALATLDALQEHHKSVIGDHPTPSQGITRQALSYQRTLVQSTERRLCSMDRRIVNIIQLSFNIVTQGDSKLMQSESQSMKTIAVMTLFFMPLSTIAGVFGTEFMKIEDGPGNHITVSQDFWLLFLIAVPLTVIVIVIWRVWYADAKGRLIGKIPHDAKRRMGWKTLRWTFGDSYGSDGVDVAMQDLSPRREV
jgi:Mg2+ and Co2+ transporter CorA